MKYFPLLLILFVNVLMTNAQSNSNLVQQAYKLNTITTAVPFLLIVPDARGGAMGDAGVASTPDAASTFFNAAKLPFITQQLGFEATYTPWLNQLAKDINLSYLTGFYRLDDQQALAGSVRFFSLGVVNFTNEQGQDIGSYKPNEFAVDAFYARKFTDHFSMAVGLRYIYSNLTGGIYVGGAQTKAGQSVATDVDFYYTTETEWFKVPVEIGLGAAITNIGAKITYTENYERAFLPQNLRLGPGFKFKLDDVNILLFTLDLHKLLVPTPPIYLKDSLNQNVLDDNGNLIIEKGKDPDRSIVNAIFTSFYDAPDGFKEEFHEINYSVGLEYWYANQFALRGGFFYEHPTKGNRKFFTLGAGLKYNVFGLDFSYLIPIEQRNPLENTLRFSLLFYFEKAKK
ncbi:MAG: type IX secretion system outer membrane channel protein PorV [Bacteroidales bacterium]|nr:type IX secretion system outer membrane channel protein PorV [Bacteroidales bacterium]